MFQNAVVEAGAEGLVIAALHCPPFHPRGGEYPYYHRETIHPTVDSALGDAYVTRTEIPGTTWPRTGTAHFKDGELEDGLDGGYLHAGSQKFVEICAGVDRSRPVDLVLYGHHHARVEHRARLNPTSGRIEYFNDFYSENPTTYYATTNVVEHPEIPVGAKIAINIVDGAPTDGIPEVVRHHAPHDSAPPTVSGKLDLPPYSNPLSASTNPKDWWVQHRPVFAQTAALGPIDERQRFGPFWKLGENAGGLITNVGGRTQFEGDLTSGLIPSGLTVEAIAGPHLDVSFAGFRLVQVAEGAISRMRYITLRELRDTDFKLPWEPEGPRVNHDDLGPGENGLGGPGGGGPVISG